MSRAVLSLVLCPEGDAAVAPAGPGNAEVDWGPPLPPPPHTETPAGLKATLPRVSQNRL